MSRARRRPMKVELFKLYMFRYNLFRKYHRLAEMGERTLVRQVSGKCPLSD